MARLRPLPLTRVAGGPPIRVGQRLQFRKSVLSGSRYETETYTVLRIWLHDAWAYLGNGGGGPVHWRVEIRNDKTGHITTTGIGNPQVCKLIARALPALIQVPAPTKITSGFGIREAA